MSCRSHNSNAKSSIQAASSSVHQTYGSLETQSKWVVVNLRNGTLTGTVLCSMHLGHSTDSFQLRSPFDTFRNVREKFTAGLRSECKEAQRAVSRPREQYKTVIRDSKFET
jgi:hypothetical protein